MKGFLEMKKEINVKSLRRFNLIMGCLHLLQGILMIIFAVSIQKIIDFSTHTPVFSHFLSFNTKTMHLETVPKFMFNVPFGIGVGVFLLLSALFHFLIVLPKTNAIYNKNISKGINYFRWYEYALSSSIMITLIALLFGVYDIGLLIAIFILNASMNLFGLLMEIINQYTEKTNWYAFIFGSIAGIGPWIIITMYAFGNSNLNQVPWFVYAIFGSYFVFFNLFPINMILQYKKVGKWKDYIYGERVYIMLSLIAKTVLAWLVFSGVMQP